MNEKGGSRPQTLVRMATGVAVMLGAVPGYSDRPTTPAETPAFTVRDSAGIEIIENGSPQWAEGEGWTIDPEPILQIGAVDGDEPYLFRAIEDVVRMPSGGIALVEVTTREIRVFDASGVHERTMGREGEGPGEFLRWPEIAVRPDGSVFAWDSRAQRLTRFGPDGTIVEETPLPATAGLIGSGNVGQWSVNRDGELFCGRRINNLHRDAAGDLLPVQSSWVVPTFVPLDGSPAIALDSVAAQEIADGAKGCACGLVNPFLATGTGFAFTSGPAPLSAADPWQPEIGRGGRMGQSRGRYASRSPGSP